MSTNHLTVWIDHKEAHVLPLSEDKSEQKKIQNHSAHQHLHTKSGTAGSGHAPENHAYFDEVGKAVANAREILLVGPGSEKHEFMKFMEQHHPLLAKKVLGIETVDHPTDNQILAMARKYFHKADQMN